MSKPTLFERLGGIEAVKATIDNFYERLLADEQLSPFFEDVKMAKLKTHQLNFFKLAFTEIPEGTDVPRLMIKSHERLFREKGLNELHFDLVAGHLVSTFRKLNVSQELTDEAISVVAPLRSAFQLGAQMYRDADQEEKKSSDDEATGPTSSSSSRRPTLMDKLGGPTAVKATVEEFYTRVLADPELQVFFEGTNMARLKKHQIEFMKIAFTQVPDGLDVAGMMQEKHAHLFAKGLNASHFDLVAGHLVASLESMGASTELIDEAASVVLPLRPVFDR